MQGDLKTYIADQGGAFSSKVTDKCTHLVANQKQYDAKGAKGERKLVSVSLVAQALLALPGVSAIVSLPLHRVISQTKFPPIPCQHD